MFFKDVIGQHEIKQKLISSVKESRVSHTQLFVGPEGCGNLALALAFAQYVNCENRQADDSCGKCMSCVKSQKMIHPDIHYSYPSFKLKSGSENPALSSDFLPLWREAMLENPYRSVTEWLDFINAENKQGNISAAECRAIIHTLSLKTYESEYKILILWRAEYLLKEGNILLKLLEEPSEKTLLILVAENREQLLSTILSRTQILSIPRLTDKDLLEVLTGQHALSDEAAAKIVRRADGNYTEAIRLLQHVEDNNQELFNRWMRLLFSPNASELMKWVEEVSKIGREQQKIFFRYALEFLHECIVLQQIGEQQSRLHEDEKRLAAWLAQNMHTGNWQQMADLFDKAHYHIERNAHPKILFLHLSLQMQPIISRKKLSLTA
ncbi:MAG TPA: DNA polymerase III subunit [Chitinophagales bacterium]|nr:DNA polymerase III subunit [Chitinophagales bacterium]